MNETDWIRVDVCPPIALLDVLVSYVYGGDPTVGLAFCTGDGRWILTGSDPDQEIPATHWMPLPSPAQGEPDSKIDPAPANPRAASRAGPRAASRAGAWGMATLDSRPPIGVEGRRRGNDGR